MPERKKPTARKAPAKRTPAPKKTTGTKPAAVRKPVAPAPTETRASTPGPGAEACPRCGTTTFGPEQRIRVDGARTVRYTVLVCERGHTFAKPIRR